MSIVKKYKKDCRISMELLDTENQDSGEGNSRERERETVATMENWSLYVERYSTTVAPPGQASPNHSQSLPERPEPATNHPVSSDQAARGGRGRKRKNTNTTDIKQKIDGNEIWQSVRIMAKRKPTILPRNIRHYQTYAARINKAAQERKANLAEEKKPFDSEDAADGSEIISSHEMECQLVPLDYRLFFIMNEGEFYYRYKALARSLESHPLVTKSKNAKFHQWFASWTRENVSEEQHKICQDWLMGRYENLIPHRTRVVTDNNQTRTPYRQYNRYRVDYLQ
ncbi:paired amphipathic helix protein Sin3a-like [Belonocnema kinseyi]|uniref:paired amphipathic helix protein Sin3a-like n=1 Tax=Belonocnema kinseyi TaxID=2817044 RepID=UPI00143D69E1|nr:paired amphipathic helix protein Sin3a-like [Belonocnema kinseyi]